MEDLDEEIEEANGGEREPFPKRPKYKIEGKTSTKEITENGREEPNSHQEPSTTTTKHIPTN